MTAILCQNPTTGEVDPELQRQAVDRYEQELQANMRK